MQIKCNSHYAAVGSGSDNPRCQANGTFTQHISCRRICDPLAALPHSQVRFAPTDPEPSSRGWLEQFGIDDAPLNQGWGSATIPFLEGEHALVQCDIGYIAHGQEGSLQPVCQADGTFSKVRPCVRVCKRFALPAHSSVAFVTSGFNETSVVGDWAMLVCDAGYTLSGTGDLAVQCVSSMLLSGSRLLWQGHV